MPLGVCIEGAPQQLPVRFLLPEEEPQEAALLSKWMDMVTGPHQCPVRMYQVRSQVPLLRPRAAECVC